MLFRLQALVRAPFQPEHVIPLEDDPVDRGQIRHERADGGFRCVIHDDGNDALVMAKCQVNFLFAYFRADRMAADDEQENIGLRDGSGDLIPPLLAHRDARPVDPRLQLALGEGLVHQAREGDVLAGIGDEHVGHSDSPCG